MFGETEVSVGSDTTENALAREAVPPPGDGFVTVTVLAPGVAPRVIDSWAESVRSSVTETEVTEIPDPNDTLVVPLTNPLPWTVTVGDCPAMPLIGETDEIVGAGFLTWNPFEYAPVP